MYKCPYSPWLLPLYTSPTTSFSHTALPSYSAALPPLHAHWRQIVFGYMFSFQRELSAECIPVQAIVWSKVCCSLWFCNDAVAACWWSHYFPYFELHLNSLYNQKPETKHALFLMQGTTTQSMCISDFFVLRCADSPFKRNSQKCIAEFKGALGVQCCMYSHACQYPQLPSLRSTVQRLL